MLTVSGMRGRDHFAGLAGEWDALVSTSPDGSLFETSEWITSWMESYWPTGETVFLLVHDGPTLAGAAALLIDEDGEIGCRGTLTLPRNVQVPHASFVAAAGRRREVLDAVFEHLAVERGVTRVVLPGVERDSAAWDDTLGIVRQRDLRWLPWEATAIPRVRIESTWDEYLKSRESHVRSELKRKLRNVEKSGAVEWVVATTPESCAPVLPDVFRIEARSWKQSAGTSFLTEQGAGPFYESLAYRAAERGWLRLYVLYVDGNPVAHLYGIVYKNEYLALKTSYDGSAKSLSPGAALMAYALRDAFAQGYDAFDFLGVESRWKAELATEVRHWSRACVFSRHAVRCRACQAYEAGVKPFVRAHFDGVLGVRRRIKELRPSRGTTPPSAPVSAKPGSTRMQLAQERLLQVSVLDRPDAGRAECERDLAAAGLLTLPNRSLWERAHGRPPSMFVAVRQRDRCIYGLAVREERSRAMPGHAVLRAERVPATQDLEVMTIAMQALADLARTRPHVLRVAVETFALDAASLLVADEAMRAAGFEVAARTRSYSDTIVIDLSPEPDVILASFHATARRHIRAAAKHPVVVRTVPAGYGDHMNALLQESFARTGGAFRPLEVDALAAVREQDASALRVTGLFCANTGAPDDLLAFAVAFNHGPVVEYGVAASTRRAPIRMPLGYPIAWDLIQWARSTGARWFDFGGVTGGTLADGDPRGGISRFKRFFSAHEARVGQEWVLEPNPFTAGVAQRVSRAAARLRRSSSP